jgi:hypothetical protein
MSKMNQLLFSRLKQKFSKTSELAQASSQGQLSSFSGIFRVTPLTTEQLASLRELLSSYQGVAEVSIEQDLLLLSDLTSEIKAISNQAAILHGERIKKAQTILKNYRDGAFSAWLLATYGNRQTPYNSLQYYELYQAIPSTLVSKLDAMPRQAVYALASRDAPLEKKQQLLESYRGETKNELLARIRQFFPLEETDGRKPHLPSQALLLLQKLIHLLGQKQFRPTPSEREALEKLLEQIQAVIRL